MIDFNTDISSLTTDFLSRKVTLILEDEQDLTREHIMSFVTSIDANKYYGMVGRENNMIPFLSIIDNLMLGISKKQKHYFLDELHVLLKQFKLSSIDLSLTAQSLSKNEQLVLQMIRALILKQTIVVFDSEQKADETDTFLLHLMPILYRFAQKNEVTLIITSQNKELANSIYYDQCVLFEELLKKDDK